MSTLTDILNDKRITRDESRVALIKQLVDAIIGEDCGLENCDAEAHKIHAYILEAQRQRAIDML